MVIRVDRAPRLAGGYGKAFLWQAAESGVHPPKVRQIKPGQFLGRGPN